MDPFRKAKKYFLDFEILFTGKFFSPRDDRRPFLFELYCILPDL
jgi:hypothetical protein